MEETFQNGVLVPLKMKRCDEFKDIILSATCNNRINENEEFDANLNLLKRKTPNQFGHMLLFLKNKFV